MLLATIVQIDTLGTATKGRSGDSEAAVVRVLATIRVMESRFMARFRLRLKLFLRESVRSEEVEGADEKEPNNYKGYKSNEHASHRWGHRWMVALIVTDDESEDCRHRKKRL